MIAMKLRTKPGRCGRGGSSRRSGDRRAGESRSVASGAYGTVLIVPLADLPDWLPAWCLDHLGGEPSDVVFQLQQIVAPPLPNPPWVRWDHTDSGVWPAIDCLDNRDQSVVPAYVADTAERARRRILAARLPCVLGYADFEAQNLRWHGQQVWAVHDWDSLAWQPEAALAGAASGSFASAGPPTLAPIESSEAFLVAYQDIRGRTFTAVEQEIAWAASLWMAAYNAREAALHGDTAVGGDALRAQGRPASAKKENVPGKHTICAYPGLPVPSDRGSG
jgi:hypothetical protein